MLKKKYSLFLIVFIYMITLNVANGQEKINLYTKNKSETTALNTAYKITLPSDYTSESEIKYVYKKLNLDSVLDFEAFKRGYIGFKKTEKSNSVLTIIDFTKPSTEKRLFVIDMDNAKLLYNTYVSHGKNSGDNYAKYFSNELNSYKSSPGFYKTETTYHGGNGYSLRLDGLEKGINDKAHDRAIVVHGASYANPNTISAGGRLGRSLGCPALPTSLARPIIDTIKNGSILYIHVDTPEYKLKSSFVDSFASSK